MATTHRLQRVISGGQTGVDQAGWKAAKAAGIPTGGTMPRGFLTEEGPRPEFAGLYGAHELATDSYPARTEANVRDSDGTIWFGHTDSPGARQTLQACQRLGKPFLVISVEVPPIGPEDTAGWIRDAGIRLLNVAGNRESSEPGIGSFVELLLERVFVHLYESTFLTAIRKDDLNGVMQQIHAGDLGSVAHAEQSRPLGEAAFLGRIAIMRALLAAGVSPTDQSGYSSPLSCAVAGGQVEAARLLLEAGAHIESGDEGGLTPLMEAARSGHLAMVELLIQRGANVNACADFAIIPLWLACDAGAPEVVQRLLDAGARSPEPPEELMRMAHRQRDFLEWRRGRTAEDERIAETVSQAIVHNRVDEVKRRLAEGFAVNYLYEEGQTPLSMAASNGHADIVRVLLESGADPNLSHGDLRTPLEAAVEEQHHEVVRLLLEAGVDPNQYGSMFLLGYAWWQDDPELERLLLKAGADPRGWTRDTWREDPEGLPWTIRGLPPSGNG